jgi:ribosomal protein S18 acetylase RimI-like enzyme
VSHPRFQPEHWQIAWDVNTGRVAGHVLAFIDQAENEKFKRKRGYTEGIGVDRTWRRRGVARALIVRSLRAQKAAGMTESTLAADSDSTSGVTRLYESCGFQVVQRDAIYRKPIQEINHDQ